MFCTVSQISDMQDICYWLLKGDNHKLRTTGLGEHLLMCVDQLRALQSSGQLCPTPEHSYSRERWGLLLAENRT